MFVPNLITVHPIVIELSKKKGSKCISNWVLDLSSEVEKMGHTITACSACRALQFIKISLFL